MEDLYKRFVKEDVDENGVLRSFKACPPENFNFAFDVVDVIAERDPDKLAMLWVGGDGCEKRFTFRDMAEAGSRAANVFRDAGIRCGDRVMLVLKRHWQFWPAMMGLCKLGAVAVPATHLLTKKDFLYRFNAAGVSGVVCASDDEVIEHAESAFAESPTLKVRLAAAGGREGWDDFDALLDTASAEFARPEGDEAPGNDSPMLMYFTSGTTGEPKMVWHSFTYPLGHIITARYWQRVKKDGLHFTLAETGWGKAVWGKLYGQWLCESAVFTYDFAGKFKPADILAMIEKYKITTFCAPPTVYRFMMLEDMSKYDLSSLTHATIAGEALNPEVFDSFYRATGIKLCEGFGQTETTLTVATLFGTEPKPGSMGKVSPAYKTAILNSDGQRAMSGEVGEIVVFIDEGKPCGLFGGYYRDPDRTAAALSGSFYRTGDMAWRDEDGYFWYVGRADDLIKSSGYRIGPFEIESVLCEHPAVTECAVTGTPDPVRGQVVKASIVLAKGYEPSPELTKELQDYVKRMTAPYKYPRVVEYVDELPKTISGKIRRKAIRDNK